MEDKLDHDERLRLECVALAVTDNVRQNGGYPIEDVLRVAAEIEKFITGK